MATNGALPASSLVALSTPGRLLAPAAASFERLRKDAKTTGTEHVDEAYRDLAAQERLFTTNYTTDKSQAASGVTVANGGIKVWDGKTWYRKPGKATAAKPGTSNHGWGVAVDWQNLGGYDSSTWKAFASIATKHGWSNVEGKSINEPWHWVYDEAKDQYKETGVELTDRVTMTAAMKAMSGWTADTQTVAALLGYMSSASWASGKADKENTALLQKVSEQLDKVIANQAETIKAIKAIAITANVEMPDFDLKLTATGTAVKKPKA